MENIVALIIPFIALSILSVLIDRLTMVLEGIMHKIPGLPDHFEWIPAYFIVLAISYAVCFFGDFGLFLYLDIQFKYQWMDYLLTSLIISGGSYYVRQQFDSINNLPSIMTGVTSSIKSLFKK